MKKAIVLLLVVAAIGCSTTSLEVVRTQNRQKLLSLSSGMSKADVLNIMGTETISIPNSNPSIINNPYRTETVPGDNEETYEIFYYYTDKKKADGVLTDDEMTPLIFLNGKLRGWGWRYLGDNIQRYQFDSR